ncbi:hypothetical protein [Natrialbaceae archaeon AArc-T1-2]|uniref:hypothetical protein n=1 Tax=Natrialbaceae archaeon AArc-T1-2 TaxID=3053904 RepID=UPI00255A79E8|nr:hypothetical protein [Natrialbaceae archaeon AArc-T1-2]WIV68070.1 hypothetical protein QQ977_04900 [Natrialbaceae archaeon AArc-T1-2]
MKTLEVTDEQYAYVQRLREELSETVVGKYGHVRDHDAIQFLIDTLEDDLEVDGGFEAPSMDDLAVSREEGEMKNGATELEEPSPSTTDDSGTDEGTLSYDEESQLETADATEDVDNDGTASDSDDASADDSNGDATDDDMLDRMMSLLETHDDKWAESPSADYRYRVTLPDGTTEDVQTKDDVRALLFKHY